MANLIERAMDFLKLTYEEYDEEEDDAAYDEPVKRAPKKSKKEEKANPLYEEENEKNTQSWGQSGKKKNRGKSQTDGFSGNSKVERAPVRFGSNVSVVRGGNNNMESEIVSIRPKDDKARQEIGNRLLEGKTVLINLEGLELDVAQRIVDFTFGVCYAIKGNMKFPSKYIVIAVPDEVGLSGVFENSGDSGSQRTAGSKMSFDN